MDDADDPSTGTAAEKAEEKAATEGQDDTKSIQDQEEDKKLRAEEEDDDPPVDKEGVPQDDNDDDDDDSNHDGDEESSSEEQAEDHDNTKAGEDQDDEDKKLSVEDEADRSDDEDDAKQEEDDSNHDSEDESRSEEESSSEEEEEEEDSKMPAIATSQDGHELSAYELQRLQRIRRNKEYLASLGLERNKPSVAAAAQPKRKAPRKPRPETTQRRSSLSRSTKEKVVNYAEMKVPRWQAAAEGSSAEEQAAAVIRRRRSEPKEDRKHRMDKFIYLEFRRMKTEVNRSLKTAEKNVRAANVEYRHYERAAERFGRKQKKFLQSQRYLEADLREKQQLGCTAREIFRQAEARQIEIGAACHQFDAQFQQQAGFEQWMEQQDMKAKKMKMIDALDRFPKALKSAMHDLDLLLLERSPRDPPPPRRGTRKRKSVDSAAAAPTEEEEEPKSEPPTKKGKKKAESPDGSKEDDGTWSGLAAAITAETLSSSARTEASPVAGLDASNTVAAAAAKPKKVVPKNVGGWVSPAFSKEIDRNWLDSDTPAKKFDPSRYIPQVGDTVLYYPAGHRAFLKEHPDHIGRKSRNVTRMTLWDRAKREKRSKLKKVNAETADKKEPPQEASPEKAESADKKKPPQETTEEKSSQWWNEEWLSLIEGDIGRYPLLCRVERTQVEFPPDPYAENKIVTKDDESGGVQVTWKIQSGDQNKKKKSPPLCLATMLRPLTPLLPPGESDEQLSLAPNFYVVTFPSKLSPYIVPFSWAYRMAHSLSVGCAMRLTSKPEWRGKVKRFRSLGVDYGSSRLDDMSGSVRELCTTLRTGTSFAKSLEAAVASDSSTSIPIADACAVIEQLESFLKVATADETTSSTTGSISLVELIRRSFPLWKEVVVESGTGKKLALSAWELSLIDTANTSRTGPLVSFAADVQAESGLVYRIDEPLRAKLECTIEDYIKDTPDAKIFCPLVGDDDAPSYSCAVPRSMSFNRILRRLKAGKKSGSIPRCYYRTVDSLIADITTIADNCVLYNSPDSSVVELALDIVPTVKRLVGQVSSRHWKEKESREKSVEERRQAILLQCNSSALMDDENNGDNSASRIRGATKQSLLQPPYTEPLHRSWVQDTEPDETWCKEEHTTAASAGTRPDAMQSRETTQVAKVGTEEVQQPIGRWVPQCGDVVFYSRSLHAEFVKGHLQSLTTEQCTLPRFTGGNENLKQSPESDTAPSAAETTLCEGLQNRWLVGKIVWVRAEFPRAKKRGDDYENTFEVASPVLALGIRFDYSWASGTIHKVYWRPCTFRRPPAEEKATSRCSTRNAQKTEDSDSGKMIALEKCTGCDLNIGQHFVRPAWIPLDENTSPGVEAENQPSPYLIPDGPLSSENLFAYPKGISDELIAPIDRCLDILKRRCLNGIAPDYVDPKFCMENVKRGWCPVAKTGKKLPTFERLLAKGNSSGSEAATGTRGVEKVDEDAISLLSDAHYLPPWTSSLSDGSQHKTNRDSIAQSLSVHETLSPNPNFCLELIQLRLRNGYYRDRSALVHDIREAYVSSVLLLLAKPAAAKKGPGVSIRRIAKELPHKQSLSTPSANNKKSRKTVLNDEEKVWMERIHKVRSLYATALVCGGETECMERIFGTAPKKKKAGNKRNEPLDERELIFREARNKLMFILSSLQRDPCINRAPAASRYPALKVKVRFTGQNAPKNIKEKATSTLSNRPDNDDPDLGVPSLSASLDRHPGGNDKEEGESVSNDGKDTEGGLCGGRINVPDGDAPALSASVDRSSEANGTGEGQSESNGAVATTTGVAPCGDDGSEDDEEVHTTRPIVIDPYLVERNDALVSAVYGKPGRMATCIRCHSFKYSVFSCRIAKRHSHLDFDWAQVLPGTHGINGLLHMLKTGTRPPEVASLQQQADQADQIAGANETNQANPSDIQDSGTTAGPASQKKDDSVSPDPIALFDKAKEAVSLANIVAERARERARVPARLSEEFIQAYFPIDPSDGHYNYCIICGISGDVICCEGCPNVVHANCVALSEIPDEDWFCSKCTSKEKQNTASENEKQKVSPESQAALKDAPAISSSESTLAAKSEKEQQGNVPTGDNDQKMVSESDDDEERLERLLSELKALRKKPSKRDKKSDQAEDEVDDGEQAEDNEAGEEDDGSTDDEDEECAVTVGTKIVKSFGGHGDYVGTVVELPTKDDSPFYKVRYADGDEEDMEEDELRACLEQTAASRRPTRTARLDEPTDNKERQERTGTKRGRSRTNKAGSKASAESQIQSRRTGMNRRRSRNKPAADTVSGQESAGARKTPGKRCGRPRKNAPPVEEEPKRKRGRPRKDASPVKEEPKRKRGRPRKTASPVNEQPKRKRGRPRKSAT